MVGFSEISAALAVVLVIVSLLGVGEFGVAAILEVAATAPG
jgi:hypothetical protein